MTTNNTYYKELARLEVELGIEREQHAFWKSVASIQASRALEAEAQIENLKAEIQRLKSQEEWSGGLCEVAPTSCWIDDKTGEHVNAITGTRTPNHPVSTSISRFASGLQLDDEED